MKSHKVSCKVILVLVLSTMCGLTIVPSIGHADNPTVDSTETILGDVGSVTIRLRPEVIKMDPRIERVFTNPTMLDDGDPESFYKAIKSVAYVYKIEKTAERWYYDKETIAISDYKKVELRIEQPRLLEMLIRDRVSKITFYKFFNESYRDYDAKLDTIVGLDIELPKLYRDRFIKDLMKEKYIIYIQSTGSMNLGSVMLEGVKKSASSNGEMAFPKIGNNIAPNGRDDPDLQHFNFNVTENAYMDFIINGIYGVPPQGVVFGGSDELAAVNPDDECTGASVAGDFPMYVRGYPMNLYSAVRFRMWDAETDEEYPLFVITCIPQNVYNGYPAGRQISFWLSYSQFPADAELVANRQWWLRDEAITYTPKFKTAWKYLYFQNIGAERWNVNNHIAVALNEVWGIYPWFPWDTQNDNTEIYHEDFAGSLLSSNKLGGVSSTWDQPGLWPNFPQNPALPLEPAMLANYNHLRHGTAVAGTLLAQLNQSYIAGATPAARAVVWNTGNNNSVTLADEIYFLDYSDYDVLNYSWSMVNEIDAEMSRLWNDAFGRAVRRGTIIMCSAGNTTSAFRAPAIFSNVLAITGTNQQGQNPDFAQVQGNAPDQQWIDFAMPAYSISTLNLRIWDDGFPLVEQLNGTSFASPLASAVAMLAKAWYRDLPQDVFFDIAKTCTIPASGQARGHYDGRYGWGILDANAIMDVLFRTYYREGDGLEAKTDPILPPSHLDFSAYPTPTNGVIHIDFNATQPGNYLISLHDILGREVLTSPLAVPSPSIYRKIISVQDYPSGNYYLMINTAGRNLGTRRITIIK